jgi:hypothetical protein
MLSSNCAARATARTPGSVTGRPRVLSITVHRYGVRMAFPRDPVIGQTYRDELGVTYSWDGRSWIGRLPTPAHDPPAPLKVQLAEQDIADLVDRVSEKVAARLAAAGTTEQDCATCEEAKKILANPRKRPKKKHGRKMAIAKMLTDEKTGKFKHLKTKSVVRYISQTVRDWEKENPDK